MHAPSRAPRPRAHPHLQRSSHAPHALTPPLPHTRSSRGLLDKKQEKRAERCDDLSQKKCDGKCANIFTDPKNCGDCGLRCGRSFVCEQGGCVCPPNRPDNCDGRCTSILKDPFNCEPRFSYFFSAAFQLGLLGQV